MSVPICFIYYRFICLLTDNLIPPTNGNRCTQWHCTFDRLWTSVCSDASWSQCRFRIRHCWSSHLNGCAFVSLRNLWSFMSGFILYLSGRTHTFSTPADTPDAVELICSVPYGSVARPLHFIHRRRRRLNWNCFRQELYIFRWHPAARIYATYRDAAIR